MIQAAKKKACITRPELLIRNRFRLLWEQHVYWTRMVILGIIFDTPDLEASTARLLRNVPDFETVFKRFYGSKAATEFGTLLKEHLVIAADLVKAAKAGDSAAAADAERKWYANANEIVRFLNRINPFWSKRPMKEMWHHHLALTKNEAVEVLKGEYVKSVDTFDTIEKLAMEMADGFSKGVIRQFKL
jgi:hypothetical protein